MQLRAALDDLRSVLVDPDRLVRAIASGRRRGAEPLQWPRVELRPVDLSAGVRLQVVRSDGRQAFTTNVAYGAAAASLVAELLDEPYAGWHVDTVDSTIQLRVTKRGGAQVHRSTPPRDHRDTVEPTATRAHDRVKPRLLASDDPVLRAAGITTASATVRRSREDKLRQVEDFLRALDPVLDAVATRTTGRGRPLRVVDLGCGNAYLTFAAYRFLTAHRGTPATLVGVDVKAQARQRNTKIAAELGWTELVTFVEGAISAVQVSDPDIVLALHACDTATDDALARGVRWRAPVILAAPCCHHDIQAQLRRAPTPPPYGLLTRHGILRERLADVLTDALRASLLRLLGYRVEVIEFVATRHTPRNVLIRAVRTDAKPAPALVGEYQSLVGQWGVNPRLAVLLEDMLRPVLR